MTVEPAGTMIYEGKAKILYEGPEPGTIIVHFKDDATAFNAQRKGTIQGKGVINNRISEFIMSRLNGIGVTNHFIKRLNLREQLIREVEIIPLEVVCRNIVAGSMSQRLGIDQCFDVGSLVIQDCLDSRCDQIVLAIKMIGNQTFGDAKLTGDFGERSQGIPLVGDSL